LNSAVINNPTDSPLTAGDQLPYNRAPVSSGVFTLLDRLLRQREEFFEVLFAGREVWKYCQLFALITVVLCVAYGLTMGANAWTVSWQKGLAQMAATAIKLPLLYLLSLAVCYPVLYMVLVLMGSKLRFGQGLALILIGLGVAATDWRSAERSPAGSRGAVE